MQLWKEKKILISHFFWLSLEIWRSRNVRVRETRLKAVKTGGGGVNQI